MYRRNVLALALVAALGAAGAGMANKAVAHGGCRYGGYDGYGYDGYGYGYTTFYGYPSYGGYYGVYPTIYRSYYAPSYPLGYGGVYYRGGGHRHHRHYDRGGLSFSIGF